MTLRIAHNVFQRRLARSSSRRRVRRGSSMGELRAVPWGVADSELIVSRHRRSRKGRRGERMAPHAGYDRLLGTCHSTTNAPGLPGLDIVYLIQFTNLNVA